MHVNRILLWLQALPGACDHAHEQQPSDTTSNIIYAEEQRYKFLCIRWFQAITLSPLGFTNVYVFLYMTMSSVKHFDGRYQPSESVVGFCDCIRKAFSEHKSLLAQASRENLIS